MATHNNDAGIKIFGCGCFREIKDSPEWCR